MATVFIPAQLRRMTGGRQQVQIEAGTLREVIEQLDESYPGIAARLTQGGGIVPGLAVSIDGALTSQGLRAPVKPDSEVHFLPAIGGG